MLLKSGLTVCRQHTAYESESQRRSVADSHTDEARQYRKHQTECHAADVFKHSCYGSDRTEITSLICGKCIDVNIQSIDQECDRDQDTSAYYKGSIWDTPFISCV